MCLAWLVTTGWTQAIVPELIAATIDSIRSGKPARRFKDFATARATVGAANGVSSARPK